MVVRSSSLHFSKKLYISDYLMASSSNELSHVSIKLASRDEKQTLEFVELKFVQKPQKPTLHMFCSSMEQTVNVEFVHDKESIHGSKFHESPFLKIYILAYSAVKVWFKENIVFQK